MTVCLSLEEVRHNIDRLDRQRLARIGAFIEAEPIAHAALHPPQP